MRGRKSRYDFDEIYYMISEYEAEHGNCMIPRGYITKEGDKLGILVCQIRSGRRKVTKYERIRLDQIGFEWNYKQVKSSLWFKKFYAMLLRYKAMYGNCDVPRHFVTSDGIKLGILVSRVRTENKKISLEEKARLEAIGFVWKSLKRSDPISFETFFNILVQYKAEYGHCNVPKNFITKEGIKLGYLVCSTRVGNRKQSDEQRAKLDEIGFVWRIGKPKHAFSFEEFYTLLLEYKKHFGNCDVPVKYISSNGLKLGILVKRVRAREIKLTIEQNQMLNEAGFAWRLQSRALSFNQVFDALVKYKEAHGNCNVPFSYISADGIKLGRLACKLKTGERKTNDEQRMRLQQIGFNFQKKNNAEQI